MHEVLDVKEMNDSDHVSLKKTIFLLSPDIIVSEIYIPSAI